MFASFKGFRQTLLFYYYVDLITDEDFIILFELLSSRDPDFVYDSYDRFDLNNINDGKCKAMLTARETLMKTFFIHNHKIAN